MRFTKERPLAILMSRKAVEDVGDRIRAVLQGISHRFRTLEESAAAEGCYDIDIAFMTREITADSGKTALAPTLTRFYEVMRASPRLRWMQTHSAGVDRPIYPELIRRGVVVTTASGANAGPVAQMAVAGVLLLARRFPMLMEMQRRRGWEPLLLDRAPRDLKAQTAAVIGMGRVGREAARLLKALPMRVIGVDIDGDPRPPADETIGFARLAEVLPRSDWVVLCCPLTDLTRGLIDAAAIELLPSHAHVINVSRGEVVVEDDLVAALKAGRLAGAYLDVFQEEPLAQTSELWDMPNVVVTPHTAGHTSGLQAAVADIFLDNLERWRDGAPLRNVAT